MESSVEKLKPSSCCWLNSYFLLGFDLKEKNIPVGIRLETRD